MDTLGAPVASFDIRTRDGASFARTGTLRLNHGEVRTPAFVPLATKGVVKTLEVREAAELGFDMVLGNTFHLFLTPGPELIRRFGGLHGFMRWDRPVITDSGGFQVFSMGHGTVADEIKGRAAQGAERAGGIISIAEEGVAFRSYLDGSRQFLAPETSMEVQAALNSDIALVFDECTPFHGGREYTARSTERTHRWLDRCLAWHADHGPEGQMVYGIVQGGVEEDLRRASAQEVAARATGGIAIGGTLGEGKDQMFEVVRWAIEELEAAAPERPRHLLGIGDVDDLVRGVAHGIDTFDCAMPTRIGRHGMAVVPDPGRRWRVDLAKGRYRNDDGPLLEGCPCPACAHGYSRAYVHYLLRIHEQTAMRLLTIHNLAYLQALMAALRDAIDAGRLAEVTRAVWDGAAPWNML
jgi:queuine tRNA-ribosyltransferase